MTGLILPYWFMAGYFLYMEDFGRFTGHFRELILFQPIYYENYRNFDFLQISTIGLVIAFTIIAALHGIRTSFNDKIRTRMFYISSSHKNFLSYCSWPCNRYISKFFLGLLVMNSAPILSHYFALTSKRFTDAVFILFLFMFAALSFLNIWKQWLTF